MPDRAHGMVAPTRVPSSGSRPKVNEDATTGGGREDLPTVLVPLLRTVRHFFPDFPTWLRSVNDRRNPHRIIYPIAFELWTGLFLFFSKLSARRQIQFQFSTPACLKLLNFLAASNIKRMMAPDTLPYGIARIPLDDLCQIRQAMIYRLIRSKRLVFSRLLNRYYMIAIDMTGYHVFDYPHCDSCIRQEFEGKTLYLHEVLEAKLVTQNGMAFSLASEFIENPTSTETRQDCELRAFYRLVPKIKELFPQLSICLLLDSLYAIEPVVKICEDYEWKYISTFKEGRGPARFEEYERLVKLGGESRTIDKQDRKQIFRWLNGLTVGEHQANVLECQETKTNEETTRFVWMSNFPISAKNCQELGNEGARQRWRVENEGFNMQKKGGYGLEHAYSEGEDLMKRFYILLQIAHIIYQLLEKGLLKTKIKKVFGSIRNVARRLLEEIRITGLNIRAFEEMLEHRIQIRFDTS